MSGYLFYDSTGIEAVDKIAEMLHEAGNASHCTSGWQENDEDEGSLNDKIQDTLNDCASEITALRERVKQMAIVCNSYGKRLVLLGEDDVTFYGRADY